MKLTSLADSAQTLLEQLAIQLAILGVDVPPSQYVGSGIIPWDGPSLTLYLGTIGQGQPGVPIGTSFQTAESTILWCTFYAQLLREVPSLQPGSMVGTMVPDADELGGAGALSISDAQGLTQAAIVIHQDYTATDPGQGFVIESVTPLGPDGGLAGMRLALSMSLD